MSSEILPAILDGQYVPDADHLHLVERPDVEGIVDPVAATDDAAQAEAYATRLALVHEIDLVGRTEPWSVVGARHGMTGPMAHYLWTRYQSVGEAALRPGTRASAGFCVWLREPRRDARGNVLTTARGLPMRQIAGAEAHEMVAREIGKVWGRLGTQDKRRHAQASDAAKTVVRLQDEMAPFLERNGLLMEYRSLARFVERNLRGDAEAIATRSARRHYPSSSGRPEQLRGITDLLQVVCADSTWADVLLVSSDGLSVIERVFLLYAFDVRSRALWSWLVCRRTPSAHSYLKLFERGIMPKDALCDLRSTRIRYPVHGIPQLMLTDRGMAEASEGVRFKALGLNLIPEVAPPLLPQMKGHVERVAGTVSRALLHQLPGTTLSNPLQLGRHDAMAEAARYGLTYDRFEAKFDKAIIDGLMDRLHTSLGRTPLEEWERVATTRRHPRTWPTDAAARLRLGLLPLISGGTRDRNGSGIEFRTRTFRPTRPIPSTVQVWYDPDDLRTIALLSLAGEFICDAVARDLPLEIALSEDEVLRLFSPSKQTMERTRQSRRDLFDIIRATAEGAPISRREASVLDAAVGNSSRPMALREPDQEVRLTSPDAVIAEVAPVGSEAATAPARRLRLAPPREFRDE